MGNFMTKICSYDDDIKEKNGIKKVQFINSQTIKSSKNNKPDITIPQPFVFISPYEEDRRRQSNSYLQKYIA